MKKSPKAAARGGGSRKGNPAIVVAGESIAAGHRHRIEIPVARLPTGTWLSMPVEVVHGENSGPCLWISAAVHGDELNGVEIVRRVLRLVDAAQLRGTLIAVPIVNVFGFTSQSRYLPDRRDLNRSFPGSPKGSLASRLANLLMEEIVAKCSHGIDLHTGSNHRTNLPQIRADLRDPETRRCADVFGAPVAIDARTRDGSLRHAAGKLGKTILLYEAGEALRFDERSIDLGVRGVLRVMAALNMVEATVEPAVGPPVVIGKSVWVRARKSGIARVRCSLGDRVAKGATLAVLSDAFGGESVLVRSPCAGVVIGQTNNPLVHQGDAIAHVGQLGEAAPD